MRCLDNQALNFFGIPHEVMDDERLTPEEFRIYAHLSCCVLKSAEPSIETIARKCILKEDTVRACLDRLNELGWLSHFHDLALVQGRRR